MTAHHPTLSDPVIVTTPDRAFFICWVELRNGVERWVFVGADRARYNGPVYRGECTLDAIRALVALWWETVNLPNRTQRKTPPP